MTPDPTRTGSEQSFFASLMSFTLAGSPVAFPVIITPSDKKNSAACAVSPTDISDVIEWDLE